MATSVSEFRPASVQRVKRNVVDPPSKRAHSGSSPPSTVDGSQIHSPSEQRHVNRVSPLNSVIDEDQRPESTLSVNGGRLTSQSFSSMTGVDEKELGDRKQRKRRERMKAVVSPINRLKSATVTRIQPTSIDPLFKQSLIGSSLLSTIDVGYLNSPMDHFQVEDVTLLNGHNDEHQRLKQDFQYNFRSANLTRNIEGKQKARRKNRRRVFAFNWFSCCWLKTLASGFVLAACGIGIAALVFSILAYVGHPSNSTTAFLNTTTTTIGNLSTATTTTATTSSTSSTSTSSTSTTSTSTTSTTSTSTTSVTSICAGLGQATVITLSPLPDECTDHVNISDVTRKAYYQVGGSSCDDQLFSSVTWVQFEGQSGSILANCPVPFRHCGTTSPGWYSGVYPALAGDTTTGDVCYNWGTNTCSWKTSINITNCNGYYVYALSAPPICDARYCTV